MKEIKNFFLKFITRKKEESTSEPHLIMSEESCQKIIEGVKEGKAFKVKDSEGKVIYAYPEDHLKLKS